MSFLAPIFLAGMAAVAAPIILHMIQRQRYPDRPFTTLRFFDKTIKHNVIRRRLIDRVLLVLRVLAILLLALGLSRPFIKWSLGEKRMSLVIVLDNSPSMGRQREGKTLFESGRELALSMLDELQPNDRVTVLFTATMAAQRQTGPQALVRELREHQGEAAAIIVSGKKGAEAAIPGYTTDTAALAAALKEMPPDAAVTLVRLRHGQAESLSFDHQRCRDQLKHARLSEASGDLEETIRRAGGLLAKHRDGDQRLLVIADFQMAPKPIPELAGIDVVAVPLNAQAGGANLAVTGVDTPSEDAVLGQRVNLTVSVRNCSRKASGRAKLIVSTDARTRPLEPN